jgi:protoheme ferro-lyase
MVASQTDSHDRHPMSLPMSDAPAPYDAFLLVSFGGPEGRDDVMPFLENVLRGRNVPSERMLAVAEHYYHFDGISPINAQNRELIAALKAEFARDGITLPIYWGNRNWHPLLTDTMAEMKAAGVRRVLAYFTSAFSSYSGCRQYRENVAAAQELIGPEAPQVDKLRVFYNHPGFIETMVDRVRTALEQVPSERRAATKLVYTAHSIPDSMAVNCNYQKQLAESRARHRRLSEASGRGRNQRRRRHSDRLRLGSHGSDVRSRSRSARHRRRTRPQHGPRRNRRLASALRPDDCRVGA